MARPNFTELGIDPTKLEDFSKPEHQEEFFKLQKLAPDIAREYINLAEAEAWDENLKRHANEHYEQYMQFDEKRTALLLGITKNREEFENEILPNVSDDLVDSVIGLLENQPNPSLEALLKQANFDLEALRSSETDFQDKARQLLDVILKAQTYETAVEQNRGSEITFTNFEHDPDIADVSEYLKDAFGQELLEKSLISEINNYPNTVNIRIGRDDYLLPVEAYQQWKAKMPAVKEHKYRAESFVPWNTDPNFSKKFIPLPIMVNSFYDEDPSGLPYLQSLPAEQRMRYYKLGTIAHEVGHHIYDYLMDSDKRAAWIKVVDSSPTLTDYADQYSDHKLKYDEVFTEAVRLKTTVPEYLAKGFSEINKFLEENFPDIQKPDPSSQRDTLEVANSQILNLDTVIATNESRKKGEFNLTYHNQPIILDQPRPIGTGGSKQVYSAQIGERHYALCIPAAGIDHPKVILEKWQAVAKEPSNTESIRGLGLYTNEVCQLLPIKINGYEFPALIMKRYQDLPYEVRDSKNPRSSSVGETKVLREGQDITEVMDIIISELAVIIKNNVKLSEDSFNLAVADGKAHLYFNDLGSAKFENIAPEFLDRYIDAYLDFAIVAFITGLTESEWSPIGDQFEYEELKEKLKGKLLEKLA